MASLVSDALAGFASVVKGSEPKEDPNTPHYHFIHSMLLPSTIKIQKELRGRRFKVRHQLWFIFLTQLMMDEWTFRLSSLLY